MVQLMSCMTGHGGMMGHGGMGHVMMMCPVSIHCVIQQRVGHGMHPVSWTRRLRDASLSHPCTAPHIAPALRSMAPSPCQQMPSQGVGQQLAQQLWLHAASHC